MFTLFFCQRPLNLIDLRTFVAKFCREDLRTFSADFFGLKNGIRKLFCFLDVCKSVLQIASTVALVEFETSLTEPLNAL